VSVLILINQSFKKWLKQLKLLDAGSACEGLLCIQEIITKGFHEGKEYFELIELPAK